MGHHKNGLQKMEIWKRLNEMRRCGPSWLGGGGGEIVNVALVTRNKTARG